jgi:hypothetical protein
MAVCRFGDNSDVYVIYNMQGDIECCGCVLLNRASFCVPDEAGMIAHLEKHLAAGHQVPSEAFARLRSPSKL